jgi:hypothetical protein
MFSYIIRMELAVWLLNSSNEWKVDAPVILILIVAIQIG